jgi:transcriptional regulator with XRE-family HTH domain
MTRREIAVAAGVSRMTVYKWLHGSMPGAAELFKISSAARLPMEWFFEGGEDILLTKDSLKSNNAGVSSEIVKLIAKVKAKASKPGAKAELARTLGVDPARISEWLAGKKEPGGEYTLRLLKWVERQERQKNADPKNEL